MKKILCIKNWTSIDLGDGLNACGISMDLYIMRDGK